MRFRDTISYNIQAVIGKKTNQKILVIESDDWGTNRMPSKTAFDYLLKVGIPVNKCPYNRFDALESAEDIYALSDLCYSLKDNNGNPLKVTANFIMANPDFEAIRTGNFESYHYKDLRDTYMHYQGDSKILDLIREMTENSVLVPQLHGREHLQVNHWMNALRQGDDETRMAFDVGVFGHPSFYSKETGINFLSAYHISTKNELEFAGNSVRDGVDLFKHTFGFTPTTFISPRYIWPLELEPYFKQVGIETLQGSIIQLKPKIGGLTVKLSKRINWMGRKNVHGLQYITRNVFFEPTLKPGFNWEADALQRIEAAFFWGKPAIISMHRLNFMGGFSVENRATNLKRLKSLIVELLKKWPDVVFASSNTIVRSMNQNDTL